MITLIYTRHAVLISTRSYQTWREIQDEWFDHKASLGPWSIDELFDFLDSEYSSHTFVRSEVESFIASGEALMSGDVS